MDLLAIITDLVLNGDTAQAKAEIEADLEYSRITGKPTLLSTYQAETLKLAIIERELGL